MTITNLRMRIMRFIIVLGLLLFQGYLADAKVCSAWALATRQEAALGDPVSVQSAQNLPLREVLMTTGTIPPTRALASPTSTPRPGFA
jgi:hypothetical protein